MRGAAVLRRRARRLLVPAALAALGILFGLRLVLEGREPSSLAFAPAVAVLALELGVAAGAVSGAVALVLFALPAEIRDQGLGAVAWVSRGIPLVLLGAGVGALGSQLRRSELLFRQIAETANEGVWVVDDEGRTLFANEALARLLGVTREELVGREIAEFTPPELLEAQGERRSRRERGIAERYDTRYRRADGREFWALVAAQPLHEAGRLVRVLVMVADIDDRKRAEEELRAREAGLAQAESIAHLGSWEWEAEGDRVRWSDELHRIFGVDQGTFDRSYESFLALVHPDDRARVDASIRAVAGDGATFALQHRVVRPSGEVRVVEARGQVERDAAGNIVRMLGTAFDVTERVGAERALAAAAAELEVRRLAERQAGEINDSIVQGIVLARYALERGEVDGARRLLGEALANARAMISNLLGGRATEPGDLRRERAAGAGGDG